MSRIPELQARTSLFSAWNQRLNLTLTQSNFDDNRRFIKNVMGLFFILGLLFVTEKFPIYVLMLLSSTDVIYRRVRQHDNYKQ